MKIRPVLIALAFAAFAAVGARYLTLYQDYNAQRTLNLQREAVEVISRDSSGLLVLTQDIVQHPTNKRAIRQWNATHESISDALKLYGSTGKQYEVEVELLKESVESLKGIRNRLLDISTQGQPVEGNMLRPETLRDQLFNETRRISEEAFDLSNTVTTRRKALIDTQRLQALITNSILMVIVTVLSGILWFRVLKPIKKFREAMQRIEKNELGATTNYRTKDEFGELAEVFNKMSLGLLSREESLKAASQKIMESTELLNVVIHDVPFGVVVYAASGEAVLYNHQFLNLLGMDVEKSSAMGFTWVDMVTQSWNKQDFGSISLNEAIESVKDKIFGSGSFTDVKSMANGNTLEFRRTPLPNGSVLCTFVDVTAFFKMNEELTEAKVASERANKAKSSFLANMSHEIRTPLNAVIGMAYVMGLGQLTAEQFKQLETIRTASHSLLNLINDILDISKIETGEFDLEQLPFEMKDLMAEVRSLLEPSAKHKGLELRFNLNYSKLPAIVEGDSHRIRQMLINLVNNGIKFTLKGFIEVEVLAVSMPNNPLQPSPSELDTKKSTRLRFSVRDTGIGIPDEQQHKLFNQFSQVDASTARKFGGTGLGLSIVKMLAEKMGGNVGVFSQPGQGSVFWFEIPLDLPDIEHQQHFGISSQFAGQSFQMLVMGLTGQHQEQYNQASSQFGWETFWADTPLELFGQLSMFRAKGKQVDCVLLNEQQSAHSLALLTDEIESLLCQTSPCAFVVLAPSGDSPDIEVREGIKGAPLHANFNASDLFNAVNRAVMYRTHNLDHLLNLSRLDLGHSQWLHGLNLMVVDDSLLNLEVCRCILENEGARVLTCESGVKSLELLQKEPGAFDLVLMDMQMPDLDGRQTTERIRNELHLTDLPIVALTAGVLREEREQALQSGVDAFLGKPIDTQQLLRTIRHLIQARRGEVLPIVQRKKPDATVSSAP